MMNDRGRSDRFIVPEKSSNKADNPAAEAMEGRDRAEGNPAKRNKLWTQHQDRLLSALARVRRTAGAASRGCRASFTQGKSRIWEICTSGSVRGVESDLHPYRDSLVSECVFEAWRVSHPVCAE